MIRTDHVPGFRVRAAHRHTVLGIVGKDLMVPVTSVGTMFYMVGFFPWRIVANNLGATLPTLGDVIGWIQSARRPVPAIFIAETPEVLSRTLYLALIGGGCHEALHRLLTCQRMITPREVMDLVGPRFDGVSWPDHRKLLLDLTNIIEDIWIERIGNALFPGIHAKLVALQDLILDMEAKGRARAGATDSNTARVVFSLIRDLGLGYDSPKQRAAFDLYKTTDPSAHHLVTSGALAPMLQKMIPDVSTPRAVAQARVDLDRGISLALAMDVIRLMIGVGTLQNPPPPPSPPPTPEPAEDPTPGPQGESGDDSEDDGEGDGAGAGAGDPDPKGEEEKGDPEDTKDGSGGAGGDDEDPEEDPEEDSEDGSGAGDPGDPSDDEEPESEGDEAGEGEPEEGSGDGGPEGEPSEDGDPEEGEPGEEKPLGDATDAPGDGEATGANGDPSKGEPSEGDTENAGAPSQDDPGDAAPATTEQGGDGAGGVGYDDAKTLLQFLLDHEDFGTGLKDVSSALQEAVTALLIRETVEAAATETRPYRPFTTANDEVLEVPRPSELQAGVFRKHMLRTRRVTTYLRTQLSSWFMGLESGGVTHGVPKGRLLSGNLLTDTYATLRGGQDPKRAFAVVDEAMDMSLAVAFVVDQSGSMDGKLADTGALLYGASLAMDQIRAKTFVVGFRTVGENEREPMVVSPEVAAQMPNLGYHRTHLVRYDVFKRWDEGYSSAAMKFSQIRAAGGTPMADGIEFALRELSARPEAFRLLVVLTDGCPDFGTDGVVRGQTLRAEEAGIGILGVGLGGNESPYKRVFKHYVHEDEIDKIAAPLVKKLMDLLRANVFKRGRRVKA